MGLARAALQGPSLWVKHRYKQRRVPGRVREQVCHPHLSFCAPTLEKAQEKAPLTVLVLFSGCPTLQTGWLRPQLSLCCAELRMRPNELPSLTLQDAGPVVHLRCLQAEDNPLEGM